MELFERGKPSGDRVTLTKETRGHTLVGLQSSHHNGDEGGAYHAPLRKVRLAVSRRKGRLLSIKRED